MDKTVITIVRRERGYITVGLQMTPAMAYDFLNEPAAVVLVLQQLKSQLRETLRATEGDQLGGPAKFQG